MKRDKMIPFLARFVSLCPALQNLLKFSFFIILEAVFFEEISESGSLLKYGFCSKSFQEDEPLTS
jgi:hypothetical protein